MAGGKYQLARLVWDVSVHQVNRLGVTGHLKTSHSGSIENQPPERAVMEGV